MRKNILALCAAMVMALGASAAFADTTVPEHPCEKSASSDAATVAAYESCMADFISAQKVAVANHQTAISKASAAMEQARTEAGSK